MELKERLESKVLLADDEKITIENAKDLKAVIDYRKNHDNIFIADVCDLRLVFRDENETTADFKKRVNAALPEAEIEKHITESNGLFLDFHTEINGALRHGVLPLRSIALDSVFERARASCYTILNEEESGDTMVMSRKEKVDFVNKCFKLYGGKAKILYRDRKITSVMSGQYYHISYANMDNGLNSLKTDFPNLSFKTANVSHEFFIETYSLNSDELNEDISLSMAEAGLDVENVDVTISAYTSDHGKVAATFAGRIILDDKAFLFGAPETIKHAGKKTEKDVEVKAQALYNAFKDNEEKIKALPSIKIKHPAGCFRLICKEFKLPKKPAMAIADTLENKTKTTAYEIYFLLNQLVSVMERDGIDIIRLMTLQEQVAKVLKIDWKKFDKEFLWAREKNKEEGAA